MPFSNYAKDRFVAPKLSLLSACGAEPLQLNESKADHWLANFVLTSSLRFQIEELQRQLIFTLLRKVDGAVIEYDAGRSYLSEHLHSDAAVGVQAYSRALLKFELTMALTYQAWLLVKQLLPQPPSLFQDGDGSEFERLNRLYNRWKHADEHIEKGLYASDSTLPVWITNAGLESTDSHIEFEELRSLIHSLSRIADALSTMKLVHSDQSSEDAT